MTPPPDRRAPALEIDVQAASPLWAAQPRAAETVRTALAAAASARQVEGEVSVLLTDDAAIRVLNRAWRQIDKPTNVLSFPAAKDAAKNAAKDASRTFVGDIVVAYETLARECADADRDFLHHLAHLSVHGFLHLIGYDHQTDAQAEEMEGLESRIMRSMNMPDPYLAREIGVGHVHGPHDTAYQAFHFLGLGIGLMIVADEMQKAMHREVSEMMQEIAIRVRAFARQSLIGDDDVADKCAARVLSGVLSRVLGGGKGQHVGRLVDLAPGAVEHADCSIAGQQHADFALDLPRRRGGGKGGAHGLRGARLRRGD